MNLILGLVLTGCLALILCVWPRSAKILQYVATLYHEVGHATIALMLGGTVQHIRIEANGNGLTSTAHEVSLKYKLVRIVELLAGYAFPVNIGIILIGLALRGVPPLYLLIFCGAISLFTLIFIRNLFGFLVTFVYGGLLVAAYLLRDELPIIYSISFLALILMVQGLGDIKEITKINFSNPSKYTGEIRNDFSLLQEATHISARIWNILFVLFELGIISLILLLLFKYDH